MAHTTTYHITTHCKRGHARIPENKNKYGNCKLCANINQAAFKKRNPNAERGKHFKKKYGITKDQFEAQIEIQNGKCAICNVVLNWDEKSTKPNLDHAHGNKKFRGVLCHLCNTGLGLFRDSIEFLNNAITYLNKAAE